MPFETYCLHHDLELHDLRAEMEGLTPKLPELMLRNRSSQRRHAKDYNHLTVVKSFLRAILYNLLLKFIYGNIRMYVCMCGYEIETTAMPRTRKVFVHAYWAIRASG